MEQEIRDVLFTLIGVFISGDLLVIEVFVSFHAVSSSEDIEKC